MLKTYHSESLELLSERFSDLLLQFKKKDPFLRPWVVVQNKEVQQWLSLQAAGKMGVVANIEFILPSELMWKLFRLSQPETPKILPADRNPMHWRVFQLLTASHPEELSKIKGLPAFSNITQAWHLSGQIADVFDLYQMYRPDMTEKWKEGGLTTDDPNEFWQLWLWRKLHQNSDPEIPDRGRAFIEIRDELQSGAFQKDLLPEGIFVFGLSHFSAPFTELMSALKDHTDIHFFTQILNPDSGDLFTSGWQDLNVKWGSLKSDSVSLISGVSDENESLMGAQHQSVYSQLLSKTDTEKVIDLHSCHSTRREIEVLKDSLLDYLDKDKELRPDEILIMVPDMEEYGPLINDIFHFDKVEPYLPVYTPGGYYENPQSAFLIFLELIRGDAKVSAVYELMNTKLFRERFDLDDDDLVKIKSWFRENFIHFGLTRSDSSFSLEKLLLALNTGYATEGKEFETFADLPATLEIKTSDQLRLISRMSQCFEFLISASEQIQGDREPKVWMELFTIWAEELGGIQAGNLKRNLVNLTEMVTAAGVSEKVDAALVLDWLNDQFTEQKASSSGVGHGVVVSSYIPYRNIPFKIVAILGMNESVFPRDTIRPGFDLIHNSPKKGERITRKDDDLLFFEVLNSVTQKLYLSYQGQDLHSENEKLPSVYIQKLIDIAEETGTALEVQKEKLHRFATVNFEEGRSYSGTARDYAINFLNSTGSDSFFFDDLEYSPDLEETVIELNDLISFFTHPCKYFLQHELNINSPYESEDPRDRELFDLKGLDRYAVDIALFKALESGVNTEKIESYLTAKGNIPQGLHGQKTFKQELNVLTSLKEIIDGYSEGELKEQEFAVEIEGFVIKARIDDIGESNRIYWRPGKERPKDLIEVWLSHLVLQSVSKEIKSVLITIDRDKGKEKVSVFGEVDDPESILLELIKWFKGYKPINEMLCFFPESSKAYFDALSKKNVSPVDEAAIKWFKQDHGYNFEGEDYYNRTVWNNTYPLETPEFEALSRLFWEPLKKTLNGDS